MNNIIETPTPATKKLLDLYKLLKNNYEGILSRQDMSSIYFIISNRIEELLEEEEEYVKELETIKGA